MKITRIAAAALAALVLSGGPVIVAPARADEPSHDAGKSLPNRTEKAARKTKRDIKREGRKLKRKAKPGGETRMDKAKDAGDKAVDKTKDNVDKATK